MKISEVRMGNFQAIEEGWNILGRLILARLLSNNGTQRIPS